MPFVACPSCGERGKIPSTLVGARIKCRKCGISFNVAGTAPKAAAAGALVAADAATATGAAAEAAHDGIAVEGLEASAWTMSDPSPDGLGPGLVPEHGPIVADEAAHAFEAHHHAGHKEYKIIWSRDKMFEGKFDVARLEETLNQYARQGWVVKAMSNPHLKDFGGGTKEEVVVLLER